LTNVVICDISLIISRENISPLDPFKGLLCNSCVAVVKTAENSGETAADPAVFPITEPPKAEDFRGERDVIR
jgi:hypothetical protein